MTGGSRDEIARKVLYFIYQLQALLPNKLTTKDESCTVSPPPPEPLILYPRDETRDSVQEILPESAVGSLTFNIPMNNDANEWFHISINPEVTLYCRVSVHCQTVLSYIMRHFSAPILQLPENSQ